MPRPDGQSCWAPIPNQMILAQLIRFDWTPIHCPSVFKQCTTTTQCPELLCCPSCTNNEPQTDQVVISPHLRTCYNPITDAAPSRALLFHSCWVIPMWNKILTLAPCERVGTRNHHDRLHLGRRVKQRPGNDSLPWMARTSDRWTTKATGDDAGDQEEKGKTAFQL